MVTEFPAGTSQQANQFRLLLGFLMALLVAGWTIAWHDGILSDPDSWWHIKAGRDIWTNGSFPVTDPYSFTFHGKPWIAKEWLSQIIMAAIFSVAGWNGIVLITATSLGLASWVFYQRLSAEVRPLVAAMLTVIMFFLSSNTFLARPHILVMPFVLVWTAELFRAAGQDRPPRFWLLGIMVLWTNMHGSFTLGFAIAGFAFLHAAESTRLGNRPLMIRWLVFLACCPLAALIHPYGFKPLWISTVMAQGNEAMQFIVEWQPFNAQNFKIHEAGILGSIGMLLWLRPQLSVSKILFIIFSLHMFLAHQRFVYIYMLLVPLAIIRETVQQIPAISAETWRMQKRDLIEEWAALHFGRIRQVIILGIVIWSAGFLGHKRLAPPAVNSAEGAINYATANRLTGSVLNGYNFGGPLIYHGIPTFVDGRTDQLFLDGFSLDIEKSQRPGGETELARQLEKFQIGWTLLPPDDSRVMALDKMPGWKRVYEDKQAVIHQRQQSQAIPPEGAAAPGTSLP